MMSRHKRNHINGSKQQHHHSASHNTPSRHDMLSFRNSDLFEHSLHPHDRLNNQRHRRDLSKCLGTHKQRRRLSIGCSRDDIVEVHPQCSEAGDEGTEICFFSTCRWRRCSSLGLIRLGAKKEILKEVLREKVLKSHFLFHFHNFPISCSIMAPTLPSDFSVQSFLTQHKKKKTFLSLQVAFLGSRATLGMTFVISFAFHSLTLFVLIHYPEYVCHGSWTENDTTFIIARHAGTKHGVCISFKPSTTDSTAAQLIVGDSCYRETMSSEIPEHHLISNVTGVVREYYQTSSTISSSSGVF